MEVGSAFGDYIDDQQADAELKMGDTPGGKGSASLGAIVVAWTDKFDGCHQAGATRSLDDLHLDSSGKTAGISKIPVAAPVCTAIPPLSPEEAGEVLV